MNTKLTRFDPFQGLTRWGEALDQFFSDFWTKSPEQGAGLVLPAFDVSEDGGTLKVTARLPGLEKKDIELQVKDGILTIRGEKKVETESKDRNCHRIERRYGSFYRALALPETVDAGKVDASFKNGILTVTMPKREEAKPKAIQIKEA